LARTLRFFFVSIFGFTAVRCAGVVVVGAAEGVTVVAGSEVAVGEVEVAEVDVVEAVESAAGVSPSTGDDEAVSSSGAREDRASSVVMRTA
jgi:hypothetical protein